MSTYIIGDVHGCLHELESLLEKINYSQKSDSLYFVGDIINRGPKSLETIRYIRSLKNTHMVLGNHELHLLALAKKVISRPPEHPLQKILSAKDKIDIIEWIRHQPLIQIINDHNILVHAGIPPQWSINQAMILANKAEKQLQSNQCHNLLHLIYNTPPQIIWRTDQPKDQQLAYTCLALTQMRLCKSNGTLDLKFDLQCFSNVDLKPWFEWPTKRKKRVFFGHWASLYGQSTNRNCIATDTGCVYGGQLSAYDLEKNCFYRIDSQSSVGE